MNEANLNPRSSTMKKSIYSLLAPQGAQGPIRSEMLTAGSASPNDLIQAHLGGDGVAHYVQMNMGKNDSWHAPQGAQGPIRNDSMHDGRLFPLSATGG